MIFVGILFCNLHYGVMEAILCNPMQAKAESIWLEELFLNPKPQTLNPEP